MKEKGLHVIIYQIYGCKFKLIKNSNYVCTNITIKLTNKQQIYEISDIFIYTIGQTYHPKMSSHDWFTVNKVATDF